ncbi:hypothetical protein JMJ35_002828 [Cladonia borealis]|uniref:Uncharacterized protein n=1 Tax=Cladonia borealis TaxID=184061 RepID=A0AA39UC84_9LECA|nr:hypothetical protein JMJ35_002828 [Cladonia borealis]
MLRLGPTQIRLDAKDLAWHVGRHHDRQARRAEVPSGEVTSRAKRSPKKIEDGHVQAVSYTLPHRPAFQRAEDVQERDTPIFSKEPVPGNARSFWDKILADAGTPTRTQSTILANATVIDPSEEFLEHTHSSRASIEDDITDVEHDARDTGVKRRIGNPFQDSDGQSSSGAPTPTSSESPEPLQNDPHDKLDEGKVNRNSSSEGNAQASSSKRRMSFFPFNRRLAPANVDGSSETVSHLLSNRMVFDGPSDAYNTYYGRSSQSSEGNLEAPIQDDSYGSRHNGRANSSSLDALVSDAEGGLVTYNMTLPLNLRSSIRRVSSELEVFGAHKDRASAIETTRPTLTSHTAHPGEAGRNLLGTRSTIRAVSSDVEPSLIETEWPSLSRSQAISNFRHPSATLPPSSLRFYQNAASSSPDQYPVNSAEQDSDVGPETRGLLTQPPRRPRNYRPRTESYSFESIEDSNEAFYTPQVDGTSTSRVAVPKVPSLLVSHPPARRPPPVPVVTRAALNASPPQATDFQRTSPSTLPFYESNDLRISPHEISSGYLTSTPQHQHQHHINPYRSLSSVSSSHGQTSSNSSRGLSPYATDFMTPSAHRRPSSHLPLPPPFSSTPRHVSSDYALPSPSPNAPLTPPHPHTPTPPSRSPNSPIRIPVYQDNRDPATQPQTPAGLRRHGVPVMMATQNPFYTAPVRPRTAGLGEAEQRVRDWQAFVTPTRRGRVGRAVRDEMDGGQENADRIGEEERMLRREMASGTRLGREEWGRRGV